MNELVAFLIASNLAFIALAFIGIYLNFKMHKIARDLFMELENKGFFK